MFLEEQRRKLVDHAGIVLVNNADSGTLGTVAGNGGHIDPN